MSIKEKYLYMWNHELKETAESIFEGIASGRKRALENWFSQQWMKVNAMEKEMTSLVDTSGELILSTLEEMCNEYADVLECFLLDESGRVSASSYPQHIGNDCSTFPNLAKGLEQKPYRYGPYCDKHTLDFNTDQRMFSDEVTLLFSKSLIIQGTWKLLCLRYLNDDMCNVIQEEDTHVFKESGDNLKDGVRTKHWGTVKNGENLNCWPGYPDYRHSMVSGKGVTIEPPHSDEIWGMMCEGDISEIYRFHKLHRMIPLEFMGVSCAALGLDHILKQTTGISPILSSMVALAVIFVG